MMTCQYCQKSFATPLIQQRLELHGLVTLLICPKCNRIVSTTVNLD
jgi:hypothetical protein